MLYTVVGWYNVNTPRNEFARFSLSGPVLRAHWRPDLQFVRNWFSSTKECFKQNLEQILSFRQKNKNLKELAISLPISPLFVSALQAPGATPIIYTSDQVS